MPDADLVDIITTAIGATADPAKWQSVCERVATRTNAVFSLIFEYDPVFRSTPILHAPSSLFEVGDFLRQFEAGASKDDPRIYQALGQKQVGSYFSEAELLGVRDENALPANSFRDGYFGLIGAASRGGAKLNDIGPFLDALTLHLRVTTSGIPDELRQDVQFLAPIFGKVIETSRIFRSLSSSYGVLLEVFDKLDCGATICDENARVLLLNQKMKEFIKEGDVFKTGESALSSAIAEEGRKLAKLIRSAGRSESIPEELIITLRRRSRGLPVVLKAAPIRSPEIMREATLILLLAIDPADKTRLSTSGLNAFGVLSKAELDVCELLIQGWPTEEIATRRNTSLETTRTQIKSATAKLACRSRLDLVRLALLTQAPLRDGAASGG